LADFYPSLRPSPLPPNRVFPAFQAFCSRHEGAIRAVLATHLVQTNEVGRSACLAPAFAYVARLVDGAPLHLVDIGAAAGLNLLFDRYLLDYGALQWGDTASPVRIACELRDTTTLPLDGWQPNVCHRIGIDLNPVDVTSEHEARWLRASIWPERPDRAEVLAQAMAVAVKDPPHLVRGDAVALLPRLLADVPANETPCVYQSYSVEYFPEASRTKFYELLAGFGAKRDLYLVEMVGPTPQAAVFLTSWRGGQKKEQRLADCPAHGHWLRWLA
jgi:hypothetical protein